MQFSECNCFGAFVEIVGQHHLVIIQENGVDKRINRIGGIILCKALQGRFRQNASAPEEITSVAETTRTLFFLSGTL